MNAYGFLGAHKLAALPRMPLAHESTIVARVQSMRTRNGKRAEPLSFAESQAYLRRVDRVRKRGVSVPQPLHAGTPVGAVHTSPERAQESGTSMPACAATAHDPSPSVAAARAGFPCKETP